jgi:hypothetical protein
MTLLLKELREVLKLLPLYEKGIEHPSSNKINPFTPFTEAKPFRELAPDLVFIKYFHSLLVKLRQGEVVMFVTVPTTSFPSSSNANTSPT